MLGQRAWLTPPDACSGPGPVPSPVPRWGVQPRGPEGQPPSFISWREERGAGGPPPTHLGAGDPVPSTVWLREPPPHGLRHRDPHHPTREEGWRPRAPQQPPTAALPQSPHRTKEPSCARTARTRRRPCRGAQGRQGQDRRLRSRLRPVQPHSLAKSLWATEQHTVTNPTGLRPAPLANLGCGDLVRQDGQPCSARAWARPSGCPPAPR